MHRRTWQITLIFVFVLLLGSLSVMLAQEIAAAHDPTHAAPEVAPSRGALAARAAYTPTTTITVDSAADPDDSLSTTCDGTYSGGYSPAPDGLCTLRRAIVEAGAMDSASRPILIAFDIPTTDDGYDGALDAWKITLSADLPYIKDGQVIIDGATQTGGRADGPKIIVHGGNIKLGETQYDDENMALGLAIQEGEISLVGDYNVVADNWVGLTDDGQAIYYINGDPTRANFANIGGGSDYNLVQNNVVASARGESIVLEGDHNTVIGNYVGAKADGAIDDVALNRRCQADAIYNNWFTADGIRVSGDYNQIGGPTEAERNVIVGMLFASPDVDTTPPYAMEVTGSYNVVENNYLGKDANGDERWICGMGMYISGEENVLVDNVIVNSGAAAMGLYGSTYTIDAITLRGNVAKNVPNALEFGPSPPFPLTWKSFNPAEITDISGTAVSGTAGEDSPCANCIVELFIDDGDDAVEANQAVITTTADSNGDWTVDIGVTLAPTQGLRTTTTSVADSQIGDRAAGTTSKFSDLYPVDVTPPDPTPTPSPTPPPTFPTPEPPLVPTMPITYATVLTVTTTADPDDSLSYTCVGDYTGPPGPAPDGLCTLRRALVEASAEEVARPVLINFNLPMTDTGYLGPAVEAWKIDLIANLPYISGGHVVISGTSQPGGRSDGPKIIVKGGDILLGEIAGDDHNAALGLATQEGKIAAVTDWNIIEACWAGLSDDGQSIHYINDNPDQANYASIRAGGSHNLIQDNVASSAQEVNLDIKGDANTVRGNYSGARADGAVPEIAHHRKCKPDAFYYNWFTGDGLHVAGDDNWVENNVIAGMLFASPDPHNSPPDAVEVTGSGNTLQNNQIGKDATGSEVGVCGVGIYVSNSFNRFIENEIVNTGLYAFGIFGSGVTLDAITMQGNVIRDVPQAIEFGPLVPPEWTEYVPAHITELSGTSVSGTSGANSPCPFCTIELLMDDGDELVETLSSVLTTTSDADGHWSATLDATLAPTEGLRTASTTSDYGQIPEFEVGTTSRFSQLYPDGVTPPDPTPTPTLSGPETVPPITYLPTPSPPPTYATVITVTSAEDPDSSLSTTCYSDPVGPPAPADDGKCTLRRAIVEANSEYTPRPVLIKFMIPTTDTGYLSPTVNAWKIELLDDLPYIQEGQVVIDGASQPGGRSDSPKIIVKGGDFRLGEIAGDDNNAVYSVAVQEGEIAAVTDRNIIQNCWAGLSDDGMSIHYINDDPDRSNYASIRAGGDNNLIQDNVSSSAQGVSFNIAGDDNIVTGNYVGAKADGTIDEVPEHRKCHADALYYNWFTGDGMHVGGARNRVEDNLFAGMLFASADPHVTPPEAMEVTGRHNLIQNNRIGVDANGKEVGVCGIGIYVSNGYNQLLDNEIVDTGSYAVGIFGSSVTLDATTLQGNTIKDVPSAIEFGPLVPAVRTYFNAAHITDISGVSVSGASGPEWSAGYEGPTGTSFCPFCRVEVFIDDGDDAIDALEPVAVAQADGDGNWSATLDAMLAPTQGLRTASTTRNYGVIAGFEISTTSRFSPLYGDPTPPAPPPEPTPPPPESVPPVEHDPIPTPPAAYGTHITVTTTADPDTSLSYTCYGTYTGGFWPAPDGLCTLRRAIIEASKAPTRPVHIGFDLGTGDAGYDGTLQAWTITAAGALPNVKGSQVTIDGASQPIGRNDGPRIILHGSDLKLGQIAGEDENAVIGLALQMGGIWLYSDRNIVQDNWLGLNDDGQTIYYDQDDPSRSNRATIAGTGGNNLIQENVIATSNMVGIDLEGDDNAIYGNYVGTRADGTLPDIPTGDRCVPDATSNWWTGAGMDITGNRNRIGGPDAGARNIIAGMLSPSTSSTPPVALNIDGRYNLAQNNAIGVDAAGQEVWICGQAMDLSGFFHQILDNEIAATVDTGGYAFGIWGSNTSLDALTLRGNTFHGFDTAIEYGPTVPASLRLFNPGLVTVISDTQITGIADDACPYCLVDVYLDNDDARTDALSYLGVATATVAGNWAFTLPRALTESEGLRTVSTVRNYGVIAEFDLGASSKFSTLFKERPPQAPTVLTLTAPTGRLWTEEAHYFVARVAPSTTTLPITYTWEATGLDTQTIRGGVEKAVAFEWPTAGTKTVTVTATNAYGSLTESASVDVQARVPLEAVSISGPTTGHPDVSYDFTAAALPTSATTPITYTWFPAPESGQGTTTASFQWTMTGTQRITVTAENIGGLVTGTHTIDLVAAGECVPVTGVSIVGATTGYIDQPETFTADVTPANATAPFTITWTPAPASGQGTTSTTYQWPTAGDYAITVTVTNCTASSVIDTHTIAIVAAEAGNTFEPGVGGTLIYTNTQGYTTTIEIPGASLSATTTFTYTESSSPAHPTTDFLFAGRAFDLVADHELTGPITATLNYHDADLTAAGISDPTTLKLYYWAGAAWEDVAATCTPASTYGYDTDARTVTVALCHLTSFGLMSPAPEEGSKLYLPLILKH